MTPSRDESEAERLTRLNASRFAATDENPSNMVGLPEKWEYYLQEVPIMSSETITIYYLGETIKLVLTEYGWRGWWVHPVMGAFGDGMDYPSYDMALGAIEELIRRSGAIDTLLATIDDWKNTRQIAEEEHTLLENSLLGFIVCPGV